MVYMHEKSVQVDVIFSGEDICVHGGDIMSVGISYTVVETSAVPLNTYSV